VEEKKNNFYSFLSNPIFYSFFQKVLGANKIWLEFSKDFINANNSSTILDIGCGPADILNFLPNCSYCGFDPNPSYIEFAKKKYLTRGNFYNKYFTEQDLDYLPKFDLVILIGVLHHMSDNQVHETFSLCRKALKKTGKVISIDPCFIEKQNLMAKFLIKNDRGNHVRDIIGYQMLFDKNFKNHSYFIKHRIWIPYTHIIFEAS